MRCFTILIAVIRSVVFVQTTDYCKLTPDHALCGKQSFSPNCGKVLKMTTALLPPEQKRIVDFSNIYRNKVAGGGVTISDGPLPQAANMEELVWDDELAAMGASYAKRCYFDHSCPDCRKVERYLVGENLFMWGGPVAMADKVTLEEAIEDWTVAEQKFLRLSDVKKFPIPHPSRNNGHLTQAIWAKSTRIGCGRVVFQKGSGATIIVVCYYGPSGNVVGAEVYQAGKPCSACPKSKSCSTRYKNLCGQIQTQKAPPKPPQQSLPGGKPSTASIPLNRSVALIPGLNLNIGVGPNGTITTGFSSSSWVHANLAWVLMLSPIHFFARSNGFVFSPIATTL